MKKTDKSKVQKILRSLKLGKEKQSEPVVTEPWKNYKPGVDQRPTASAEAQAKATLVFTLAERDGTPLGMGKCDACGQKRRPRFVMETISGKHVRLCYDCRKASIDETFGTNLHTFRGGSADGNSR